MDRSLLVRFAVCVVLILLFAGIVALFLTVLSYLAFITTGGR
jgi:hypothetical protein